MISLPDVPNCRRRYFVKGTEPACRYHLESEAALLMGLWL
jgi:hypothetical protein